MDQMAGSDGQVAGYFEEYETAGKPLTFLTVKGLGTWSPRIDPAMRSTCCRASSQEEGTRA